MFSWLLIGIICRIPYVFIVFWIYFTYIAYKNKTKTCQKMKLMGILIERNEVNELLYDWVKYMYVHTYILHFSNIYSTYFYVFLYICMYVISYFFLFKSYIMWYICMYVLKKNIYVHGPLVNYVELFFFFSIIIFCFIFLFSFVHFVYF